MLCCSAVNSPDRRGTSIFGTTSGYDAGKPTFMESLPAEAFGTNLEEKSSRLLKVAIV